VSFLLLLFIALTWMAGAAEPSVRSTPASDLWIGTFLGTLGGLVLVVAAWSRLLARRVCGPTFGRSIQRLGRVMFLSRFFVVVWFALGVFGLGWVDFVLTRLRLNYFETARLPGMIVGIAPALLTWVGLWWAHYPADRALRQQGLADNLMEGLPIHSPPQLGAHLATNFRIQVLFVLLPVMLIVGVRDIAFAAIHLREPASAVVEGNEPTQRSVRPPRPDHDSDNLEALVWLLSSAVVYLAAPELLRRILGTSPMEEGPLRRRLESLCRRSGMRYRDILIWHTHFNVGNAAVMGLLPRFRYILLSDLLLERMDDDQIEAVFAHEIGHVVHRHMAWYIVLIMILMLTFAAVGQVCQTASWVRGLPLTPELWAVLTLVGSALSFWVIFGFLSRRFERQADVYAARMLEAARPASAAAGAKALEPLMSGATESSSRDLVPYPQPVDSHVGVYGAQLFASALHRVAMINNLPVNPRNRRGAGLMHNVSYAAGNLMDLAYDWLHGSIAGRMEYLRTMSDDPALTVRFDRLMSRLYGTLLFVLIASAAYVVPSLMR
jgi:Zn-dependent protease with chaperone function